MYNRYELHVFLCGIEAKFLVCWFLWEHSIEKNQTGKYNHTFNHITTCTKHQIGAQMPRGVHFLLYFAYTCVRDLFIGGVIYLAKKIIRWWYFTCKKPENIICDDILHVNMFHCFKIPYFTCTSFTKFIYD